MVLGQGPKESATAALEELHWLPIRVPIDYKLCLLAHLADWNLRSASNGDLVIPPTRLKTGKQAFSVAAPLAWNRLPVELKLMTDTTRLKRELKTLMLSKFFLN